MTGDFSQAIVRVFADGLVCLDQFHRTLPNALNQTKAVGHMVPGQMAVAVFALAVGVVLNEPHVRGRTHRAVVPTIKRAAYLRALQRCTA